MYPLCSQFSPVCRAGPHPAGEPPGSPEHPGQDQTPTAGSRPRPTGNRNADAAPSTPPQQGTAARAACRPPLRPAGNGQFIIFVWGCRRFVGRGLDPAGEPPASPERSGQAPQRRGTSRQPRRSHKPPAFPYGRRGGVYAARGTSRRPGTFQARPTPNGGVKTPPYGQRERRCSTVHPATARQASTVRPLQLSAIATRYL